MGRYRARECPQDVSVPHYDGRGGCHGRTSKIWVNFNGSVLGSFNKLLNSISKNLFPPLISTKPNQPHTSQLNDLRRKMAHIKQTLMSQIDRLLMQHTLRDHAQRDCIPSLPDLFELLRCRDTERVGCGVQSGGLCG